VTNQEMTSSSTSIPDWSPFYCLPKAELTASGLLKLDASDNEVELLRRSSLIELRHENTDDPMAPCPRGLEQHTWINRTSLWLTITVTTHRIVLTDSSNNDSRFIHISNVHVLQGTGGPSFQHPRATYKILLSTFTYGDVILVVSNTAVSRPKEHRDAILQQIEKAFSRRQWEQATRLQEKAKQSNTQNRKHQKVGVDLILNKHRQRHEHASKLADTALSGDTEQLLTQAGELLHVIQKYTILLQKYQTTTGSGRSKEDDDAAEKLEGLLSDMGMTSALSRSQMGGSRTFGDGKNNSSLRDYYELTARQLADFLLPRFEKQVQTSQGSGIMTLTDVYCLFNRARGTNLISPEDLRQACELLGELNLGLSQRTFPSGVIVLQLDHALALNGNNTAVRERMVKLCPTTALEASHALKLSPLLALEQLEEAERLGYICRDVTLETVRFYPNKFMTENW
jgi:ESCRT-II complex subunit VPS36